MIVEINDIPPSLNQIIAAAKVHWGVYSGMKKKWKKKVYESLPPTAGIFQKKVKIHITYVFPDKRKRDYDNYLGAYKLIGDGLVGEVIQDDNQNYIESLTVTFKYEKGVKKTILNITEVSEVE